jgi:predicted DNA binding CopG/RHH family protein
MKKHIPKFKNEDDETEFWSKHDSSEYLDWSQAKKTVLPDLKPSVTAISLRLPESMVEELKLLANKSDVPYQSLLKMFLSERIRYEFHRRKNKSLQKEGRSVSLPNKALQPTRSTGGHGLRSKLSSRG